MKRIRGVVLLLCAATLASCGRLDVRGQADERIYADFDLADELGIKAYRIELESEREAFETEPGGDDTSADDEKNQRAFKMRVYEKMDIYAAVGDETPSSSLEDGTVIRLLEFADSEWAEVYDLNGGLLGYAKDGFMHAIDSELEVYAELPIEYGLAKTNEETYVEAYSHLVDIRKYFKTYSSTEQSNDGVRLADYDIKVSMKLSTSETTISEPFYSRNLCMIQYDLLAKLQKAVEAFRKEGYMIVIYDAYRPTSVQQRWFDVVRVHKWVANPAIGMGGVHDRGTALDISLINIKTGEELEMPTPMHTFTEESARSSQTMTEEARKNMDYMTEIMVSCGFKYINSEWWHFQDENTKYYLPTDHPIDSIPLAASEPFNG